MKTQKFNGRALSLAVASILAVGVGAFSGSSYAGTNTATLNVSADIQPTCEVSTTAVTFGTYDPVGTNASTPLDSNAGRITMTCTTGAAPIVALSQGAHPAGTSSDTAPLRQMIGNDTGTSLLAYNLSSVASGGTVWGNTPATGKAGAIGDGASHDLTVYGQIPAGQNVPVADYTDVVTVTVTF
jgi:spore coat protein U-like protein